MKSIDDIISSFDSLSDPDISEETLGAYLEGNLDFQEMNEVADALATDDVAAYLMAQCSDMLVESSFDADYADLEVVASESSIIYPNEEDIIAMTPTGDADTHDCSLFPSAQSDHQPADDSYPDHMAGLPEPDNLPPLPDFPDDLFIPGL